MSFPAELFVSAFVTLLVVIDPLSCAPIFASLTAHLSPEQRREQAVRAVGIAAIILVGFAAFGQAFLGMLGISLDAFRIAGGIMLFLIALEMLFEPNAHRRPDNPDAARQDVSVFPIAIPMLAGPGSIASVMLLTGRAEDVAETAAVYLALALVMLLGLVALLMAVKLLAVISPDARSAITRLLGVILAALATQIVIDGLNGAFGSDIDPPPHALMGMAPAGDPPR
ncbi:MAG: MarC family protein [Sphingomonadaceae bacterium]